MQLLGKLTPGLTATDNQHVSGRQRGLVAVPLCIELEQTGRRRCAGGAVRALVGAGAEDDRIRAHLAVRGAQLEAALCCSLEPGDVDPLAHRRCE